MDSKPISHANTYFMPRLLLLSCPYLTFIKIQYLIKIIPDSNLAIQKAVESSWSDTNVI